LAQETFLQLSEETQAKAYFVALQMMFEHGLEPPDGARQVEEDSPSKRLAAIFGVELPKRKQVNNLVAWTFLALGLEQLGIAPNLGRRPLAEWKSVGSAEEIANVCERASETTGQRVINDLHRKHGIEVNARRFGNPAVPS
jgi:hypothetical protein